MSFLDVLAEKQKISSEDIEVIKDQAKKEDRPVDDVLKSRGITTEEILSAKGEYLQIPVQNLNGRDIPFEILKYIPEESAIHYKIVPIGLSDGVLQVGLVDPDNIGARDALSFISSKNNLPFKIFMISEEDFEHVLALYKGLSGEVTKALTELEGELSAEEIEIEKLAEVKKGPKETNIIEDAPVTKIVATILRYAIDGAASDVHIEPMTDKVRVRFRMDGVLHTSLILPPNVHPAVVARIKILSDMKLDEKRKPQDGRFSARIEGRKIDFRVSTFPSYYGEKVVMRILDPEKGIHHLTDLGLTKRNFELIQEAIKKPYGLILITGPTGSGKSTTLYAMLQELDRESVNVLSLEDPVEYTVEGVSQSQVHPEIGYTFATGLRTTLRQDPDVIMVGEIRDKETAALAVQAALTGHLVLSTLHTNTALGAIPRLVDMGVEPYLIAPTLILTLAQRLVAQICPDGGEERPIEGAIKARIDKEFEDLPEKYKKEIPESKTVLKAVPTAACPKGTRGRIAAFEMFKMDKDLEGAILKDSTELNLYRLMREKGMMTMKEDAIIKALNHQIPFSEIDQL